MAEVRRIKRFILAGAEGLVGGEEVGALLQTHQRDREVVVVQAISILPSRRTALSRL